MKRRRLHFLRIKLRQSQDVSQSATRVPETREGRGTDSTGRLRDTGEDNTSNEADSRGLVWIVGPAGDLERVDAVLVDGLLGSNG